MLSAIVRVFLNLCYPRCNHSEAKRSYLQEDYPGPQSRLSEHHVFPPPEHHVFPPPPPKELLDRRSEHLATLRARRYLVPEGVTSDTPLYTLSQIRILRYISFHRLPESAGIIFVQALACERYSWP